MTISGRTYIHYMLRNINKIYNNKSKEENNRYNNNIECIICGQFIPQNELKHNCRTRNFCNSTNNTNNITEGSQNFGNNTNTNTNKD